VGATMATLCRVCGADRLPLAHRVRATGHLTGRTKNTARAVALSKVAALTTPARPWRCRRLVQAEKRVIELMTIRRRALALTESSTGAPISSASAMNRLPRAGATLRSKIKLHQKSTL